MGRLGLLRGRAHGQNADTLLGLRLLETSPYRVSVASEVTESRLSRVLTRDAPTGAKVAVCAAHAALDDTPVREQDLGQD